MLNFIKIINMADQTKTIQVSYETWELLSLIKTRKQKRTMGDVIDLLLDKKKLDKDSVSDIFKKIDEL